MILNIEFERDERSRIVRVAETEIRHRSSDRSRSFPVVPETLSPFPLTPLTPLCVANSHEVTGDAAETKEAADRRDDKNPCPATVKFYDLEK